MGVLLDRAHGSTSALAHEPMWIVATTEAQVREQYGDIFFSLVSE